MGSNITKAMGAQVVMVTSSNDTLNTSDVIQAPYPSQVLRFPDTWVTLICLLLLTGVSSFNESGS